MSEQGGAHRNVVDSAASGRQQSWLSRWTRLEEIGGSLFDAPATLFEAWARTTSGVVALLLALQILTGLLLAFYYVPSAESAHTTVSFIEKAMPAGSWIRALHAHGSNWLALALVLHLAQRLFVREGWRRRPVGWTASVALLALVLAGAATGYSLPWDVRAFYSTRVAANVAGGLPLFGAHARAWLVGGADLSTLTVSRFYALHVFLTPALILVAVAARLFIFRERADENLSSRTTVEPDETTAHTSRVATTETSHYSDAQADARGRIQSQIDAPEAHLRAWRRAQLARQSLVAGLVFLALALYASKFPAPLAPSSDAPAPGYLPRPGAQFLWLFQLLKYLPGALASLVAVALPLLLLGGLALLPLLDQTRLARFVKRPRLNLGTALFTLAAALVLTLTTLAYVEDARNPRVREQLSRQARDEAIFRSAPFEPQRLRSPQTDGAANGTTGDSSTLDADAAPPPEVYTKNCAKCHGAHAEGRFVNPKLVGISARPQRTAEDLVAILNNPSAYGLEPRMPSFARKLSDEDKRLIADWLVSLKPPKPSP